METKTENHLGSDCSGNTGDLNRVLTLSNTILTSPLGFMVYVSGLELTETDYTITHKSTGSTVTFLNRLWDDMPIIVNYNTTALQTENYTGADCSGSSGDLNRVITLSNTGMTSMDGFMVYVSGLAIFRKTDYTIFHKSSNTEITFLNRLWDDMTVVIEYYQDDPIITGVGSDFELGPLSDFGVEVTRTPVTVTTDYSGNKTYSDGTDETIEAVFINPNKKYNLDKSGLAEVYDAQLFIKPTQTMNKYDKINYNSKTYRVETVNPRNFNGTPMFKMVGLFFLE